MRVMHIEAGRYLYGGARQVLCLLDGLGKLGVDSVLVCAAGGALAMTDATGRRIVLPIKGDLDLGLLGRLGRVIAAERPDIVHVHSRRGADLFGGLAAERAGVPALLTRRVDSPEPAAWVRLKLGPYAAIVAISRHIESQLADCGVDRGRMHVIASAVDTARYRPRDDARQALIAEFGFERGAFVVGVAAQLIARKGHAALLAALAELKRERPGLRALLFGRGPLARRIRVRIRRLGLDAIVHMTGFREDLPALLPGLDVLVHPAEREGLGVALLEAMASGVPIVACQAGGVAEAVGDSALLVSPLDADALAEAIGAMIEDEPRRRALAASGLQRARELFTVDAMAGQYMNRYQAILGSHDGGC